MKLGPGEAYGLGSVKKGCFCPRGLAWQPHLFCPPSPYAQPDVSPRVTAATGDICRSSLGGLTKAVRTWPKLARESGGLGGEGRRGRWEGQEMWTAVGWCGRHGPALEQVK